MNERIRDLRKAKKLTQAEFGEKIGLSQRAIATMESGGTVTERTFSAICKEFDVNPEWLRNGVGEMFLNTRETLIDQLAGEYELLPEEITLLRMYLDLTPEQRRGAVRFLRNFATAIGVYKPAVEPRRKRDEELTREEKHAILDAELDAEESAAKRGITASQVFIGTNGTSKKFNDGS